MVDDDNPATDEANALLRFRAPAPAKIDEWTRHIKQERTLNDYVEDVHRALWDESIEYQRLLDATDDDEAVEGSLGADNTIAAQMVRAKALATKNHEVSKRKLATISRAINVVMRRYRQDRKRRRNTIGGEYLPPNTPNNGVSGE
jgi:3'-phosphoadenosine 5'-phosphosulfate sulfotransferase (PAPS reductase)/FAD synthetase